MNVHSLWHLGVGFARYYPPAENENRMQRLDILKPLPAFEAFLCLAVRKGKFVINQISNTAGDGGRKNVCMNIYFPVLQIGHFRGEYL